MQILDPLHLNPNLLGLWQLRHTTNWYYLHPLLNYQLTQTYCTSNYPSQPNHISKWTFRHPSKGPRHQLILSQQPPNTINQQSKKKNNNNTAPPPVIQNPVDTLPASQVNLATSRTQTCRLTPFLDANHTSNIETDSNHRLRCPYCDTSSVHLIYKVFWMYSSLECPNNLFERWPPDLEQTIEAAFIHHHRRNPPHGKLDLKLDVIGDPISLNQRRAVRRKVGNDNGIDEDISFERFVAVHQQQDGGGRRVESAVMRTEFSIHRRRSDGKLLVRHSICGGPKSLISRRRANETRLLRKRNSVYFPSGTNFYEVTYDEELKSILHLKMDHKTGLLVGKVRYVPYWAEESNWLRDRLNTVLVRHVETSTRNKICPTSVDDSWPSVCRNKDEICPICYEQLFFGDEQGGSETDGVSVPDGTTHTFAAHTAFAGSWLDMDVVRLPSCSHWYHRACIIAYAEKGGLRRGALACPYCSAVQVSVFGPSPKGWMAFAIRPCQPSPAARPLGGYEQLGSIEIVYCIPGALQMTEVHPSPGSYHGGLVLTSWLPLNEDGVTALFWLKRCFALGQTFRIVQQQDDSNTESSSTAAVELNDIPHKLQRFGNSTGENDSSNSKEYLDRLEQACLCKGIRLYDHEKYQLKGIESYLTYTLTKSTYQDQSAPPINVMAITKEVYKADEDETFKITSSASPSSPSSSPRSNRRRDADESSSSDYPLMESDSDSEDRRHLRRRHR